MKKILMVGNTDFSIYIYRKELAQRLIDEGYQVFVSTPNGDRVPELLAMGCQFIETKVSSYGLNPLKEFLLIIKYFQIIRTTKPEVVLTFTIKPNVYAGFISRITKTPYICNITGMGSAVENGGILQKISLILMQIGMKKAKTIFFQNKSNLEFFSSKKIGEKNGKLLPGSGVNLTEHCYEEYPDEIKPIELSFIARLKKEKGIDLFIEAAKYYSNIRSDLIFNVAGFAAEEDYLDLLSDLDKKEVIVFWGKLLNVHELIKRSHCIIHPTYYPEGMSNILLEGAATGRPLISTNQPGCEEIIEDNETGYLINRNDLNDLIEKIQLFLNLSYEERKIMGIKGREKVEKQFNREIINNIYLNNINKISVI